MITNGEPKDGAKEYIDYVAGKDFAKQVEDMGYIPMTEFKK
jgi:phosphate transport system substrate-binding protein